MDRSQVPVWTGIVLGFIGTALSIFNFVRSYLDRRVTLKITPQAALWLDDGGLYCVDEEGFGDRPEVEEFKSYAFPAVHIINQSQFPIYVREIGFCTGAETDRAILADPRAVPTQNFPYKVEPRDSITMLADKFPFRNINSKFNYMYVKISNGHFQKTEITNVRKLMRNASEDSNVDFGFKFSPVERKKDQN